MFCRCSTGVALHPLKILVSHLPPPVPGGVAPKFGSEKVSRYTGVSQLQLQVSRYTVQLSIDFWAQWREFSKNPYFFGRFSLLFPKRKRRSGFFRTLGSLVHHRLRSQIASDQRLRPITDTLIGTHPAERAFFGVRSAFDRDRRFWVFRSLSDHPEKFHSDIDNTFGTLGASWRYHSQSLCSTNPPSTKDTRSSDQSFALRPEPPFTEVSEPSRPEIAKKSQKVSSWGSGEKSQKIPENVYTNTEKNTQKGPKIGIFGLFGYFLRLFSRLPRRPFLRLFCDFGPGRSGDSCFFFLEPAR